MILLFLFLPLVFVGDQLAFVPNFDVDINFQTKSEESGLEVTF
jgi:hypothetical protein